MQPRANVYKKTKRSNGAVLILCKQVLKSVGVTHDGTYSMRITRVYDSSCFRFVSFVSVFMHRCICTYGVLLNYVRVSSCASLTSLT